MSGGTRDPAGRTRRALAAELLAELEVLDGKLKALKRRLAEAVTAAGSGPMDILGVGPGRRRPDPGRRRRRRPVRRPQPVRLATGTAPIDASSGEQIRHLLSRAGNRRLNHVLYIAAVVQIDRAGIEPPPASAAATPRRRARGVNMER